MEREDKKGRIELKKGLKGKRVRIRKEYKMWGKKIRENIKDQELTKPEDIFKELEIKPKKWYDNLQDKEVKKRVKKELKDKTGVYIIINKVTRNYYIGSASLNNLYIRFHNHIYSKNKTGSRMVQEAVKNYGINNIIYGILYFYPKDTNIDNNSDELYALETFFIKLYLPQYNIRNDAGPYLKHKNNFLLFNKDKFLNNLTISDKRKTILIHKKTLFNNLYKKLFKEKLILRDKRNKLNKLNKLNKS